jgi:hypothetical protein
VWFPTQAASDGSIAGLLGLAGPYLALTTSYRSDLGTLSCVPLLDPTVTAVGLPLYAAGPVDCSRGPNHPHRTATDPMRVFVMLPHVGTR